MLHELLGYPAGWLAEGQAIPPGIQAVMANVGEVLRPDMVLKHGDAEGKPILLVALYPPEQDLEKPISGKLWKATAGTRMMELLHAADVPLGLITNGEEWMLVSAPRGETTGFASWYADLWMQEPLTLRAFHSLLHLRRLVGVAEPDTLPALFIESSKDQQEVTDQLGYQVRQAVEVLVQAFDRIDAESGRTLLERRQREGVVRQRAHRDDAPRLPFLCRRTRTAPARRPAVRPELRRLHAECAASGTGRPAWRGGAGTSPRRLVSPALDISCRSRRGRA